MSTMPARAATSPHHVAGAAAPAFGSEPRQPLDRRRILQTALELVDSEGLPALSMRKLGVALGVEAMAIYYHVPNKAALLEGIAELVLEQLTVPMVEDG